MLSLTYFFYGLPFLVWSTIFIVIVSMLSYLVLKLTHAYLGKFAVQISLASAVLAITGTIFAVMLAMVTVDVLGNFFAAEHNIIIEANEIGNIFRFGLHFPKKDAIQFQKITHDYLDHVLNVELPAQNIVNRNIDTVKVKGFDYLDQMTTIILNSQASELLKRKILDELDTIYIQRRMRIAATDAHSPTFLWCVLGLGCLLLVVNFGLIKTDNIEKVYFLVQFLILAVSIILILMILYNYPFSGTVQVNTHAFEQVMKNIELSTQINSH